MVPRIARVVAVAVPHHVTQRGNNRQQVFFSDTDRRLYLTLLGEHCRAHGVSLLGYCLIPNHVHLITTPRRPDSLAKALGRTHQSYAVYWNTRTARSGHVWQNRFFSAPLGGGHVLEALRYVDLNPVRARLTEQATDTRWSSARAHVEGIDRSGLLDMEAWLEAAPAEPWRSWLEAARVDDEFADRLRRATRTGRPLGDEAFVERLERTLGRRLKRRKPGPKPRSKAARAGEIN